MAGDVALDTNIVIAHFASDPAVVARVSAAPSVFVPAIVLGELYFGANKSRQVAANLQRIEDLAARTNILPCDLATARLYGQIKQQLRAAGTPIPDNDVWIAALAMQHHMPLLTRDTHFQQIAGLAVESC